MPSTNTFRRRSTALAAVVTAADGQRLWTTSVGRHLNDTGPLTKKVETIFPGDFGGVETPMAFADGRLFVPWLDLPIQASASGPSSDIRGSAGAFKAGRCSPTAFNAATGAAGLQHQRP